MDVPAVFSGARDRRVLGPGDVLFREGEQGDLMFGVVDGELALYKGQRRVAAVGPGEVLGEMALVDRSPRSLTAVASTTTTVAGMDRDTFLYLVSHTPNLALQVMTVLARRVRALDEALSRVQG
jgi:CRP/FNR family cyclic AMP-dependent transcriptional regulator